MASPEEIPNIEPFPLSPRVTGEGEKTDTPEASSVRGQRTFTPARAKVEFWHQGEQATRPEKPAKVYRRDHARRSDQMGLLLAVFAVVLIVVVVVALYMNNEKYSLQKGASRDTVAPVVDFYQGNRVFNRKVQEEKKAASVPNIPAEGANEDMEISLQAQMAGMNAKLEKMRTQKLLEEPPIPDQDMGSRPAPVVGARPTDVQKFNSPLEFNGMLPSSLKDTNSASP